MNPPVLTGPPGAVGGQVVVWSLAYGSRVGGWEKRKASSGTLGVGAKKVSTLSAVPQEVVSLEVVLISALMATT